MRSITELRDELRSLPESGLSDYIARNEADGRGGAKALVEQARKRLAKLRDEEIRVRGMRDYERQALTDYLTNGVYAGIDEAGRGPLAGPVAAAAVIMPGDYELPYVNDSKQLTAARRDSLYEEICETAVSYSVAMVDADRIDEINILQATYEAMRAAVEGLDPAPEALVVDAVHIPGLYLPQATVIKGDARCYSIAAASILAKVTRDRYMEEMDKLYPEYGFAGHKGYGSAAHIEAIRRLGPSPLHRRSFLGNILPPEALGRIADPGPQTVVSGKHAKDYGAEGERMAAEYVKSQGIRILERNLRFGSGELDLVGQDSDGRLLFIEVKRRMSGAAGTAAEAVDERKRAKLRHLAQLYLKFHGLSVDTPLRFDVAAIDGDKLTYIPNAF